MFEHYTEAKTKKLPKWVWLILIVSASIHVIVIMAVVIRGWWQIEKLALPKGGVAIAVSAPPPAPPPAKKGTRNKHKKKTDKKVIKRKPTETTQPVKLDKPLEATTDIDSDVEGDPDGSENGVAWSTCTGPACDPNSPLINAPPPPPPETKKEPPPQVVPQQAVEQQRISGDKNIVPDDTTKLAIKRDGLTRVVTTVKMCLSSSGSVNKLDMLKSSGYPAYDSLIKSTMRRWKYKPFKVNGKSVPVCTAVTFIYNQKS